MSKVEHPGRDQVEILALLAEECGEVIQVIGKCLRHGLESHNPLDAGSPSNLELLEQELGDVLAAIDIAKAIKLVSPFRLDGRREDKLQRIGKWLHYIDLPPHLIDGKDDRAG